MSVFINKYLGGMGGMFGMSESTAKLIDASEIKVAFKDVAGDKRQRRLR